MLILDGKTIASRIQTRLKQEVRRRKVRPHLAVVLAGGDARSRSYVSQKQRAAKGVGIAVSLHSLPRNVAGRRLGTLLLRLGRNPRIHGIILQRPLPAHLATAHRMIPPEKDVDCLTPENQGLLWQGKPRYLPPTPAAVMGLIRASRVSLPGKHAVVIGRSSLVGRPVAELLLQSNATVTVCHSKTRNLAETTKRADILVVAAGKPRLVKASMVKRGAVVIDVGISVAGGKLVGDVDFARVAPNVRAISPVPGGVGPLTVAMLMRNVVQAADDTRRRIGRRSKRPVRTI